MTDKEFELQHDKVSAEIAKLIAETAKINSENAQLAGQGAHLAALTQKALNENKWYVAIVASGGTLAIVAVAKLFL